MSTKRLRSVCQSIGHHSVSGMCHVHPHLGEVCKAAARSNADIDLLEGEVLLEGVEIPHPLKLAASALGVKFTEILRTENMDRGSLQAGSIEFQFSGSRWPAACEVKVETTEGKTLNVALSEWGGQTEFVRGSA